jgi:probable HAF family extracellular repeat protein
LEQIAAPFDKSVEDPFPSLPWSGPPEGGQASLEEANMRVIVALIGGVLLSLEARAQVVKIGPLFPADGYYFQLTMPGEYYGNVPLTSPMINAAGDVIGESFTVYLDGHEDMGAFRYSNGAMHNLGLGGAFGITDDGAAWGGFLACPNLTNGIQRLGRNGSCQGIPGTEDYVAVGDSITPSGHLILGHPNGGSIGRPIIVWERGHGGAYSVHPLGTPIDPYSGDTRFQFATTFTATNINERGEYAVTATNNYVDQNPPYPAFSFYHSYVYRYANGQTELVADLGEGIVANAINNAGEVAGLSATTTDGTGSFQIPFVYSHGSIQAWSPSVTTIPGWQAFSFSPTIVGINDKGEVAFSGSLQDGTHSFLRKRSGRFVDVGSIFPAGDRVGMFAQGLNNRGQIVGFGSDFDAQPNITFSAWIFQDTGDDD